MAGAGATTGHRPVMGVGRRWRKPPRPLWPPSRRVVGSSTAIRLAGTDGNPATTADPNWNPLGKTPADPAYIDQVLCDGAERADAIARPNMDAVKDIVGFIRRR